MEIVLQMDIIDLFFPT